MNIDYTSLVLKSFDNGLTEDERHSLDKWLLDKNNLSQYQKIEAIWKKSGQLSYPEIEAQLDIDQAFKNVMERTQFVQPAKRKKRRSFLVASSLAILVAAISYLTLSINSNSQFETIYADNNMEYVLPDNSKVWLSKGSELSYQKDFDNNRNVKMNGKVLYEVTHNPEKPFVIDAEGMEVTVLGTKFIVSNTDEGADYVDVINGKVKVDDKLGKSENLILTKGMAAQRSEGNMQYSENNSANEMFWASKSLRYNNVSLETIFDDLEIYFDKKILTNNQFSNCKFKGTFSGEKLEDVLSTLQVIYELEMINDQNGVKIEGPSCK